MHYSRHSPLLAAAIALGAIAPLGAQSTRTARFLDSCRDGHGDNEKFCETRDLVLPAGQSLTVDGRENGGITVHSWAGTDTKVTAMIETHGETARVAQDIMKQIHISTDASDVRAEGPDATRGDRSWSVSYEIWTPVHTELALSTTNGGIAVDGMDSRMDLETVNGGLDLTDVAGDIRGVTVNGGLSANLSGDRWTGAGLDLRTSNGGVRLSLPSSYSAQLETGTVNGRIDIEFPITVQGSIGRRLDTQLGSGGPPIRALTTNGSVSIRHR